MKSTNKGMSLNLKFFLLTAFIIVLLVAVTLWSSSRQATSLAKETIYEGLKDTLSVFQSFQEDRYTKLKMTNKLIAQDPYVQAYIRDADEASILDLAKDKEAELRNDFIIVTDSSGMILARTDKPASRGTSVAQIPLVKKALEGEEVTGFWLEKENLFNAIALPVITGDSIIATFVVGYAINDSLAADIKKLTHSETAFFLTPPSGEPNLIATTVPGVKEQLLTAFQTNKAKKEPFSFSIGPEEYIGVVSPIANPDGQVMGEFAAFRSLDRELYGFRQFQKSILFVGLGIMILAFLVSFLGSRQITGPLRSLTEAINEVKEGNYDVQIEVNSKDEVGILAESFRKLLSELREKAQLVQYLSQQPIATLITSATQIETTVQKQETSPRQGERSTLSSIKPGSVIGGRYEVQSLLGTGGMGIVVKARDRQLDDVVALKMLKSEAFVRDPDALERFKQELKLARKITHRHVLRTYDYSEVDNFYCISMEYIKGITLKQLIRQRGVLPLKIGLQIGKQICSGLDAAHEKGVVHRDVKPQNVLLESTGDAKIMDFGIARIADIKGMTTTGTVMGTPDYMSPEQAQGLPVDHRVDIYSTGVVLYEMFCGQLPFTADSPLAVLNKHVRETPQNPSLVNPLLPAQMDSIILKALEKKPEQRYQNVSQLYDELDNLSSTTGSQLEKTA